MLTREFAIKQSLNLIKDLRTFGYTVPKSVIFGSIVSGKQKKHSDIDLALWDSKFTGCLPIDYEPIKHILRKYERIELHTYNLKESPETNPFLKVIEKEGIELG